METGKKIVNQKEKDHLQENQSEQVENSLSTLKDQTDSDELKSINPDDVVIPEDAVEFSFEEDVKFGNDQTRKMKERMDREKKKEVKNKKRNKLAAFITNHNMYLGILSVLDFLLNSVTIIGIVLTGYYTINFLYSGKISQTLAGCLVMWVLVKVNEKIH